MCVCVCVYVCAYVCACSRSYRRLWRNFQWVHTYFFKLKRFATKIWDFYPYLFTRGNSSFEHTFKQIPRISHQTHTERGKGKGVIVSQTVASDIQFITRRLAPLFANSFVHLFPQTQTCMHMHTTSCRLASFILTLLLKALIGRCLGLMLSRF